MAEAEVAYEHEGWLIEPRALQLAGANGTPGLWKAVAVVYSDPARGRHVELKHYISRQTFPTHEEAVRAGVLLGHQMIDSGLP